MGENEGWNDWNEQQKKPLVASTMMILMMVMMAMVMIVMVVVMVMMVVVVVMMVTMVMMVLDNPLAASSNRVHQSRRPGPLEAPRTNFLFYKMSTKGDLSLLLREEIQTRPILREREI